MSSFDPPRKLFKDHFDDPAFSDITLQLSNRSVNVHRVVLCRRSEYFTKLLNGNFQVEYAQTLNCYVLTD